MPKTLGVIFFAIFTLLLTGCGDRDRADALLAKPETQLIGEFEGCQVSFVNRGYDSTSFYMAKCPGEATTTTKNSFHMSGKVRVSDRSTAIVQSTQDLQADLAAQKKKVEELEAQLQLKTQALSKLTDKEKAALGLEPEKQ